ncbi:MAG: hypothetical protein HY051_00580 [Candidatus Aenigmarchaeota archaeon]|nr:hypothetical protein [Candidatus Aenigmarchaeota archaeon]
MIIKITMIILEIVLIIKLSLLQRLILTIVKHMLYMNKELYTLRIDPRMKKEITLISKVLHTSESEWIRSKLSYDIKETLDLLRTQISMEYAKGTVTKKDLEEVFGKEMAKTIEFTLLKVKSDLEEAKKIAKNL